MKGFSDMITRHSLCARANSQPALLDARSHADWPFGLLEPFSYDFLMGAKLYARQAICGAGMMQDSKKTIVLRVSESMGKTETYFSRPEIPLEEVEQRLLAFCRTARVLPGDDLRARSTWPEEFVDVARRIDAELYWQGEREDKPVRHIPSPRDLDDVLVAGDWFARLRDPRFDSKTRNPWDFNLEQKLVWWRSLEPQPSWRLIQMWQEGFSHTALCNRYKRAIQQAFEIANRGRAA